MEWDPTNLDMQALYQAFLARKTAVEQGKIFGRQIIELSQNAGLQQDQIGLIKLVLQQHSQAFEFVWENMANFASEAAGLAQQLQPVQTFASQVHGFLQQFYNEGAKNSQAAADFSQNPRPVRSTRLC